MAFDSIIFGIFLSTIYFLYWLLGRDSLNNLILLNTPITHQYYQLIPNRFKEGYYSIAQTIDAELIDCYDYVLPDTCHGDASHLNCYGATIFSQHLNTIIHSQE